MLRNPAPMQSNLLTIGIDEAGRGAWAGPVVAGAVYLQAPLRGAKDSKMLTASKREELYQRITERCFWGVGVVDAAEIDSIGIKAATNRAMVLALEQVLSMLPEGMEPPVFVDGNDKFTFPLPHQSFIRGDTYIKSISCASIIAKVTRDRHMVQLAEEFGVYHFEQHKGYGTDLHQKALAIHGPCKMHRFSYAPIKLLMTPE